MRKFLEALEFRFLHETHHHEDIPVRVRSGAEDHCLSMVISALDLIRDVDPRIPARIRRLLKGGIVIANPRTSSAWYDEARKACFINQHIFAWKDVEGIATMIVHELCHARLMHHGIRYDEPLRFRTEKVCMRRELAFARRLARHRPGGHDYAEDVIDRLENLSPDIYTDAEFARRERKNLLLKLRTLRGEPLPRCVRSRVVFKVRKNLRLMRRERHD